MQLYLLPDEQLIDLFQTQASGLRIEEIDQWDETSVEHCEIDVCLPPNAADGNWRDLHHKEREYPIRCCG